MIKIYWGVVLPGDLFSLRGDFSLFFPFSVSASPWSATRQRMSRTWSVRTSASPTSTSPPCFGKAETSSSKASTVRVGALLSLFSPQLPQSKFLIKTVSLLAERAMSHTFAESFAARADFVLQLDASPCFAPCPPPPPVFESTEI